MKRTFILAMAVASMLSSCKQSAKTAIASTEKYEGTLRSKGTVRGAGNTYFIFPFDTLAPFVDELVSDVYSGKLQAYYPLLSDTAKERAIAVEDLGKLGQHTDTLGNNEITTDFFKPSDASFVSFEQKYFYDTVAHKIRTEVTKVFVSRDVTTADGTFIGSENMFYIKLN